MLFKKSLKCPILKNLMIISFPTLQPNQLRHSIKGIAYRKTIPTMIPITTRTVMHLKLNRVNQILWYCYGISTIRFGTIGIRIRIQIRRKLCIFEINESMNEFN